MRLTRSEHRNPRPGTLRAGEAEVVPDDVDAVVVETTRRRQLGGVVAGVGAGEGDGGMTGEGRK